MKTNTIKIVLERLSLQHKIYNIDKYLVTSFQDNFKEYLCCYTFFSCLKVINLLLKHFDARFSMFELNLAKMLKSNVITTLCTLFY